jgi:hypothetical protein
MTALASWCDGDRWMADLPVDEIVPMFYRLGPDDAAMREHLSRGHDLARECRTAHGYITNEPITPPPTPRRAYLFSPQPWKAGTFARASLALEPR